MVRVGILFGLLGMVLGCSGSGEGGKDQIGGSDITADGTGDLADAVDIDQSVVPEVTSDQPGVDTSDDSLCIPDCSDADCDSDDGCGQLCGCPDGGVCTEVDMGGLTQCLPTCEQFCLDIPCGEAGRWDGFPCDCGECEDDNPCTNDACEGYANPPDSRFCTFTPDDTNECDDGVPETVDQCIEGECVGCQPQCEEKGCGNDGCGGECGTCPDGQSCSDDQCIYPGGATPIWNRGFSGNGVVLAADIAGDDAGNFYLCGTFIIASVDFGEGPASVKGGEDLYLVKLDGTGELLWAKTFGGGDNDFCRGLSSDGAGGVYMVGGFASSDLDLGGGVLANGGGDDIFVARFDDDGDHLWSYSYGIDEDEAAWGAATDASGDLYVTGRFGGQYSSTMDFGDIEVTSNDKADTFVARFDSAGTPVWAKGFGGTNVALGREISVGADGRVAVAGEFFNAGVPFEYGGSDETTLGMGWNVFVLVLDSKGEQLWAKTFGANGDDAVRGIAVDVEGNVSIAGHGKGTPTLDFGKGPMQFLGEEDIFLARFDGKGNPLWAKLLGSEGDSTTAAALASNEAGDLYLSGVFDGANLDLGGAAVGSSGGSDILLARYAADGNLTWSVAAGTASNETVAALTRSGLGTMAMIGGFEGTTMDFGLEPVTNSLVATPAVFVVGLEEN
jgi:hypothetical protein